MGTPALFLAGARIPSRVIPLGFYPLRLSLRQEGRTRVEALVEGAHPTERPLILLQLPRPGPQVQFFRWPAMDPSRPHLLPWVPLPIFMAMAGARISSAARLSLSSPPKRTMVEALVEGVPRFWKVVPTLPGDLPAVRTPPGARRRRLRRTPGWSSAGPDLD